MADLPFSDGSGEWTDMGLDQPLSRKEKKALAALLLAMTLVIAVIAIRLIF